MWTESTASGAVVDHGGQWIGPGQDRLAALADGFGVRRTPTYTTGQAVERRAGASHRYVGLVPTSAPKASAGAVEAILDLDLAALDVPTDAPWTAPDAAALDEQTLGSWLAANVVHPGARHIVALAVNGVFGAEPGELSLLFALSYLHAGSGLMNLARTAGGAQEAHFVGGAQQMALRLAEELGDRVVLGAPVRAVGRDHAGVTLVAERADGDGDVLEVRAERAVVAMPPCLSAGWSWDPPLGGMRSQLAQRSPMGAVTKVHAVYDSPFWRDDGLNGQLLADEGAMRICFDDSPEDGSHGVLVGFIAGDACRALAAAAPRDAGPPCSRTSSGASGRGRPPCSRWWSSTGPTTPSPGAVRWRRCHLGP